MAQGVIANVEVGGVEVHVGERDVAEGPVAERVDPLVEASADPRDLRFGDPRVDTESRNEVVDRPGRHPVDVRLHHHGVQRLVDTAPRFQQRREVRPGTELGDPDLEVTCLRGQGSWAGAVAMGDTVVGAFVTAGADPFSGFGVDQGLERPLGELADQVGAIADTERVKQFGQGRIR